MASDVLMRLAGAARQFTIFLRGVGINGIDVRTTSKCLRTLTFNITTGQDRSPRFASYWYYKGHALSESNRALLLRFMTETETGANRIKGLLRQALGSHIRRAARECQRGLPARPMTSESSSYRMI
jgi:hypothetical protein